jgi:hypothetical protein
VEDEREEGSVASGVVWPRGVEDDLSVGVGPTGADEQRLGIEDSTTG